MKETRWFPAAVAVWALCVFGPWSVALAQLPQRAREELAFRPHWWSRDEGLPQVSVTSIAQTDDGYLWFGTFGGLVRFDGVRMEVLTLRSNTGLRSNRITALLAASDGSLWVGTEDQGTFHHVADHFEPVPCGRGPVQQIVETDAGDVWIRSRDLTRWRAGVAEPIVLAGSRSPLVALHPGVGDRLYVATGDGVFLLSSGREVRVLEGSSRGLLGPAGEEPQALGQGPGRAWVPFPDALGTPRTALVDSAGRAWVATHLGLYVRRRPSEAFQPVLAGDRAGIVSRLSACRTILEDREGNVWAGFDMFGVCRLRPVSGVSVVSIGTATRSLAPDGEGGLLIGRDYPGLHRLRSSLEIEELAGPDQKVRQLLRDSRGNLWTCQDRRVTRNGPDGTATFALASTCLAEDRLGAVWTAADGALYRLEGSEPERHEIGDPDLPIDDLCFDADGAAWFSRPGSGALFRWDAGALSSYPLPAGMAEVDVRHLAPDTGGRLWIATYGAGLGRLLDGHFEFFDSRHGLVDDSIGHIFVLDDVLWMNSNLGVFAVPRAELERCLENDRGERIVCTRISDCEGNGGDGLRTADGALWFTTVEGVVRVDPVLHRNPVPPPVRLESITANGTARGLGGPELRVEPGEGDLEIGYTALSFTEPERVRFMYRLLFEGAPRELPWTDAGERRTAYFTNLAPGRYDFEVLASNNDGLWSLEPARVAFVVEPRFHQTWWFRLTLVAATLVLVGGAHGLRMARVRRHNLALNAEIRAHRRTEAVLREREATHRALSETATDGILIVNRARDIEYANPAARAVFGAGPEPLEGRPVSALISGVSGERARLDELFEPDGRRALSLEGRRPDGPFPIEVSSGSMRREDGEPAFVLIVRDVGERRRLERQVAEAGKMEAIGRLTGGIAHDFNNILTVLLGHTSILESELERGLDRSVLSEFVVQIKQGTDRAARLVRQLLTFARRRVVDPGVVEPSRSVRELEPMLRSLIPALIELELDLEDEVGCVFVDPHELEQVILNLVVNAKDAIDGAGTITVQTCRVDVDPGGPSGGRRVPHVAIRVSDDGRGIPAEEITRVFDPFFTTKPVGSGTGLGLASAYGFAQQAGGRIDVESSPGKGATFTLLLPILREGHADELRPREAQHTALAGVSGVTVLLCDDDGLVRNTASAILTRAGYRVLSVNGPEQAIRRFAEDGHSIAVLVTDLVMPGMDGRELARRLRLKRPELPVVFISGYAPDSRRSPDHEPASEFLRKPFRPSELVEAVARRLAQAPPLAPTAPGG